MLFAKNKDVPEEVVKAGLAKWYHTLSDQDKVRLGRYLKDADVSSPVAFAISVSASAVKDENDKFAITIGEYALGVVHKDIDRYDVLEGLIVAYYNTSRFDDCLKACEEGLSLFKKCKKEIISRHGGGIPEPMCCRNYKVNVLVGAMGEYEKGDAALDEFCEMGIISEEDVAFRKQSSKVYRLQRTFDSLFAIKPKD